MSVTSGILGSVLHYAAAHLLAPLNEEKNPQTHMDILFVGFAGGVLGGVLAAQYGAGPGWVQTLMWAGIGVVVFDLFLFEM
jgi:hypothetical protein